MNIRVTHGYGALTEKEKQTLRLIVRGHDAKSIARTLDLSVHTINERLRDARRKLAVSSSREAARLLLDTESDAPYSFGDTKTGEAGAAPGDDKTVTPIPGAGRAHRFAWIMTGAFLMTLALGFLAFIAMPQTTPVPTPAPAAADAADTAVIDTARRFLAFGDEGKWDDGYQMTGEAFRKLNTGQVWASACEKVRVPLGAMISRDLIGEENLPAPPYGYEVVRFRTRFANKADAVETVTLEREGSNWRIVGITIG